MSNDTFNKFPSMGRLTRDCLYTEKLDGTNAQIYIAHESEIDAATFKKRITITSSGHVIMAGSRKRWITPGDDNYGFAAWVAEHATELYILLGDGRHYGEWWGKGIKGSKARHKIEEKRFSLFNAARWGDVDANPLKTGDELKVGDIPQLYVVPTIGVAPIEEWSIMSDALLTFGSLADPGCVDPEGIIAFHMQGNVGFKFTYEGDDMSKWQLEQQAK